MSWMRDLVETYDRCVGAEGVELPTVFHLPFNSHIEVVLDGQGRLRDIRLLESAKKIEVPITEDSGSRSGTKPKPHPLIDKLCYVALDFEAHGGRPLLQDEYVAQLRAWAEDEPELASLSSVLRYVEGGSLTADLLARGILEKVGGSIKRVEKGAGRAGRTGLLRLVDDPKDAVVRWCVEIAGQAESRLWCDARLKASWVRRAAAAVASPGLCVVTGETVPLASKHPKGTVASAFHAKLVSQNDTTGFTYRGRFHDSDQASGVGVVTSQKAHAALRWLIERQGHVDPGSKAAVVAWTPSGHLLPDIDVATAELAQSEAELALLAAVTDSLVGDALRSDVGERYALALRRLLQGYSAKLSHTDTAMVMAIAPSTPGRMAITLYRRLQASEFVDRVMKWHERHAWLLKPADSGDAKGGRIMCGAPSPKAIIWAACGDRVQGNLARRTRERVLACLLDGKPVPGDIAQAAVRRAINRNGFGVSPHGQALYDEQLATACALHRGHHFKEGYQMALDRERASRDYLFGRLLAIAHALEAAAMYVSGEKLKRLTAAERLQTSFFARPEITLRSIALKLVPYKKRLAARRRDLLSRLEAEWQDVMTKFDPHDFNDERLSGEALLGFACEQAYLKEELWTKRRAKEPAPPEGAVTEAPMAATA